MNLLKLLAVAAGFTSILCRRIPFTQGAAADYLEEPPDLGVSGLVRRWVGLQALSNCQISRLFGGYSTVFEAVLAVCGCSCPVVPDEAFEVVGQICRADLHPG